MHNSIDVRCLNCFCQCDKDAPAWDHCMKWGHKNCNRQTDDSMVGGGGGGGGHKKYKMVGA